MAKKYKHIVVIIKHLAVAFLVATMSEQIVMLVQLECVIYRKINLDVLIQKAKIKCQKLEKAATQKEIVMKEVASIYQALGQRLEEPLRRQ